VIDGTNNCMTAFDYVEVNGIRMFGPQASWATDVSAKKTMSATLQDSWATNEVQEFSILNSIN